MNATTLAELRNGLDHKEPADEKIEQIRDLLFGEAQRSNDNRIAQLEARLVDMERTFEQRIEGLQNRLDALAGAIDADKRATFDELSRALHDLGERVRHISRS
jgi:DNA anti-recombination protein RmuC